MANHLHWYINGTPGLKDGTEIDPTQPLELIINTYKVLFSGSNIGNMEYKGSCPPLFIPLSLRCETGYEILSGELKILYNLTNKSFVAPISSATNKPSIVLATTPEELNNAMQLNKICLHTVNVGTSDYITLKITEDNKITDVNKTVILCVINHGEMPQGINNAFDIINFSFSETAVTA